MTDPLTTFFEKHPYQPEWDDHLIIDETPQKVIETHTVYKKDLKASNLQDAEYRIRKAYPDRELENFRYVGTEEEILAFDFEAEETLDEINRRVMQQIADNQQQQCKIDAWLRLYHLAKARSDYHHHLKHIQETGGAN